MFGFGQFDIGKIPVNVKLGQTTVFWGESLLLNGAIHSVAYSQNPLDVWKGLATPGTEAKELFRPRVGLNVQAQVAQDVSVMAQYFFNWQSFSNQSFRYPESGSYLSIGDNLLWGGESQISQCHRHAAVWRGTDITPEENTGNWGLGGEVEPAVARRHAWRLLPPHLRHAAASDGDAGGAAGSGSGLYGTRRSRASRRSLLPQPELRLR